jgi:hypothetical protein
MNYRNTFAATEDGKNNCTAPDSARRAHAEELKRLYLLSFLLTADRAKAEQCIVTGLDLSGGDNAAFQDWAQSWARRIVINNALRLIAPHPDTGERGPG